MRRLPARAWFLLRRGVASLVDSAGTREAAQVAFFVLIAFPAALLLAIWGISTALDDPSVRSDVVDEIIEALPLSDDEGREEVEDLLDGVADGAGTLGLLGAAALIWSASGAIGALRHSLGAVWPTGEPRPYFQGKALDVGLTILVAPGLIAALGLNLVEVGAGALRDEPLLQGVTSFLVTEIVPALALFAVFSLLYRVLPPGEASWREALPGAVVVVFGAALVRVGTELYFATVGTTAIYGAIAGLLAVSISVYLLAIVAILGANVAAERARLPNTAAIDAAIEAESGGGEPILREIGRLVRSLFVRRRG